MVKNFLCFFLVLSKDLKESTIDIWHWLRRGGPGDVQDYDGYGKGYGSLGQKGRCLKRTTWLPGVTARHMVDGRNPKQPPGMYKMYKTV